MVALSFPSSFVSTNHDAPPEEFRWIASVFIGIVMCIIVYQVTGFISLLCFNGYSRLKKMERVEWKNRGFSTFHALVVAFASLYLLLLSDQFKEDSHGKSIINHTSTLSDTILGGILMDGHHNGGAHLHMKRVSLGYFLSDLGMIFWHFPALGGWEYVLHHGLSMFSIFLSLMSGQGQIYILMVLFTESTTPFVNLRWYLDVAGQKNSKLYLCNGILLFLGWLVARIILFIIFFIHMLLHFDQVKQIFDLGFYSLLVVGPILALMNFFWFWKIAKGLVKTLSKARHNT
ncbi:TLC domain-containing protein 4-B isoform X2 [Punica granatum]|nr:TLC domain-containing protein 4-B isoform X2 [Punica granatum]